MDIFEYLCSLLFIMHHFGASWRLMSFCFVQEESIHQGVGWLLLLVI
jgi:hypothetical protein